MVVERPYLETVNKSERQLADSTSEYISQRSAKFHRIWSNRFPVMKSGQTHFRKRYKTDRN